MCAAQKAHLVVAEASNLSSLSMEAALPVERTAKRESAACAGAAQDVLASTAHSAQVDLRNAPAMDLPRRAPRHQGGGATGRPGWLGRSG
jgi:hypothetical protein